MVKALNKAKKAQVSDTTMMTKAKMLASKKIKFLLCL